MLLHWMQTRWRTGEAAGARESGFFWGGAGTGVSMVPVVYHVGEAGSLAMHVAASRGAIRASDCPSDEGREKT